MKNQKQTLRRIVSFLNNPEEEGGFWLPNIQRPFVWSEEQICRLFDSILREYPISTLLIWKTKSDIRRRKFIDNWRSSLKLTDFYVPEDTKHKCLVLDGQQRLQSLFIGLRGSYDGKELYFDVLSGEVAAPDDVKYDFKFIKADVAVFPWVKFKTLVESHKTTSALAREVERSVPSPLSEGEREKLEVHLDLVNKTFKMDEALTYQLLDSIDNPELYSEDDVVEVFIRANSGGTKLGKSDLLFSLLSASWDVADEKMGELLGDLNRHGFEFSRDFVLKTALVLFDQGARYEVSKFRKEGMRERVQERWADIAGAIKAVLDFVRGKTFVQCDKALPSYLALIPLVYVRFHHKQAWDEARDVDTYLLRALLAGAFSGGSDSMLDSIVERLRQLKAFDLDEVVTVIRNRGRSLELSEDRLWGTGYGSNDIHLLFNLWYRQFNHTPAYDNNLPQIDHIFPQSALKKVKRQNPKTGVYNLLKYYDKERNDLANCMLLSKEENGAGGKSDKLPSEWFKDKSDDYLEMHLIPKDPTLWEVDQYEAFLEARRELIREKMANLLDKSGVTP